MHGVNPETIAKQRRLDTIVEMKAEFESTGDLVIDPLEAYQLLTSKAWWWHKTCERRVAELGEAIRYESGQGGTEQLRSEVVLLERSMDRTQKMLDRWMTFGLDERRVAISERQAEALTGVMGAVTASLFALVHAALDRGELDGAWLRIAQTELVPKLMRAELEAAGAEVPPSSEG